MKTTDKGFNRTQSHDQTEEDLKSSKVLHFSDLPIFALNILQSSEAGTYLTIIL